MMDCAIGDVLPTKFAYHVRISGNVCVTLCCAYWIDYMDCRLIESTKSFDVLGDSGKVCVALKTASCR